MDLRIKNLLIVRSPRLTPLTAIDSCQVIKDVSIEYFGLQIEIIEPLDEIPADVMVRAIAGG